MTIRNRFSMLALLGMLALAGCAFGGTTPQTSSPTATLPPGALEVTFVGSDGMPQRCRRARLRRSGVR